MSDWRAGDWYERDGLRRRVCCFEMTAGGARYVVYAESPSSRRFRVPRAVWAEWVSGAKLIHRIDRDSNEPVISHPDIVCRRAT